MSKFILKDYKKRQIFNGEEYFIVEIEHGFIIVHCEDIQNYMYDLTKDSRLLTDDFEHLKEILWTYYDVPCETFGVNDIGYFK